jgi:pyruvate/2-oxoglutarate dehydrogenase complex dihydrolipoamide dehydrogenase (E3) component
MGELADVVVIGMGPGGEEVAGRLAEAGLDVVGIESGLVGGECPYWGCVPSKMMIRASNLLAEARRIPGMAGLSTVTPEWAPVAHRIREEATDGWDDHVAVERFEKKGGRFIRGAGRIVGPQTVSVNAREIVARRGIVVATGTTQRLPRIEGLEAIPYWTNRDVMELSVLPSSLLILGGGPIGLEIGQALARFGVEVSIIEAAERLLPGEEPEAGAMIEEVLRREGVGVTTGAEVSRVRYDERSHIHAVEHGGGTVTAEQLLVATGRRAQLELLGLDTLGLDPLEPYLVTDRYLRAAPGLWAVGDVTGVGPFTHVAMYQANIAVADILERETPGVDYRALPRVTFTDPEIGSVGLSASGARSIGLSVRVGVATVASSARGWIHKAGNEGVIKLVEDADRGVLVGALSAGPVGGEVLGLLSLAVHAQVPTTQLETMIYAYPTFHRAVESAVADLHS